MQNNSPHQTEVTIEDRRSVARRQQTGQPTEAGGCDSHVLDIVRASTSGSDVCPHGGYLILHNVSKRHNIGTLVRSAAAFGVTEARALSTPAH